LDVYAKLNRCYFQDIHELQKLFPFAERYKYKANWYKINIAGNNIRLIGHPSYPYKSSEQGLRSLRFAAFPKPTFGFRFPKATSFHERNNCQLNCGDSHLTPKG